MPTKKRRVGFIPRNDVLEIINKLSYDNNLSYSKIINILVEEALRNRGLFNINNGEVIQEKNYSDINKNSNREVNANNEYKFNFKNKLLNETNSHINEVKGSSLDAEIYDKFLMFLQFEERMKQRDL